MRKYYTFSQNNSGGTFENDGENIAEYVIIEAYSATQANCHASEIGIIFGEGCPCCGDRWHPVCEDDGTDKPMIYNTPIDEYKFGGAFNKCGVVHYLDGTKRWYGED